LRELILLGMIKGGEAIGKILNKIEENFNLKAKKHIHN
jgi:hypothetical protein